MNNKKSSILIKEGNLSIDEFDQLSFLFKNVFNKNFSTNFIKWFYKENPDGKAITYNAFYNDKIIGHYALVPFKISIDGIIYKSGLSVFTAIDKNFRGLYLFNKLAQKTYDLAINQNIKFIVGVSNHISTKLFVRYFGFTFISKLDVKFGLGKIKKNNSNHRFKIIKSPQDLKWRLDNPRFKYSLIKEEDDIHIYNNIYKLFKLSMGQYKIDNFMNIAHPQRFIKSPLNLWIGLGDYKWKNSLYFDFPNFLKPAPLNLIIKNLSNEKLKLDFKKEDIDFQLIDFDIF